MRQETAVEKVLESLRKDPSVRSVFLKGSMGRKEHDEHSDIDLYCLVKEGEEKEFLSRRLDHLKAYKDLIFHDDIFIIAPQIIAIYEDWLHIDLFTVTEKTLQEKDFFTVLYDPDNLMGKYESYAKPHHLKRTVQGKRAGCALVSVSISKGGGEREPYVGCGNAAALYEKRDHHFAFPVCKGSGGSWIEDDS